MGHFCVSQKKGKKGKKRRGKWIEESEGKVNDIKEAAEIKTQCWYNDVLMLCADWTAVKVIKKDQRCSGISPYWALFQSIILKYLLCSYVKLTQTYIYPRRRQCWGFLVFCVLNTQRKPMNLDGQPLPSHMVPPGQSQDCIGDKASALTNVLSRPLYFTLTVNRMDTNLFSYF